MFTTRALGRPIHLGMRGTYQERDARKALVDWRLLSAASSVVSVGFKTGLSDGAEAFYSPALDGASAWTSNAEAWSSSFLMAARACVLTRTPCPDP